MKEKQMLKLKVKEVKTKKKGRMFIYIYYDVAFPNECKMGETFVPDGVDPKDAVYNRVRNDQGTSWDRFDNGFVKVAGYWDFSELAALADKNHEHASFDDTLRRVIGHRKGTTEWHEINHEDAVYKINNYRKAKNQKQPLLSHTAWQHHLATEVLDKIALDKKTFLLEICARGGKTPFSLSMAAELNAPLTIVPTYVLTSHTSFRNHLAAWEQFRNFVVVDPKEEPDYQPIIESALANKKQVVVLLSMVKGSKRKERLEYLFNLPTDRLVLIDEADYGVHQKKQTDVLVPLVKPNDKVFLMTGTNGDIASKHWKLDSTIALVYPELLMYKKNYENGVFVQRNPVITKFDVNNELSKNVVNTSFYQLDVSGAYNQAVKIDPELFSNTKDKLPSFTKASTDPRRALGFWNRMFEAMFAGKNNLDELNIEFQVSDSTGPEVSMMFVSGATTNTNLLEIARIAQNALPNYYVQSICGASQYLGTSFTNENAEELVKQIVERYNVKEGKPVLLISAGMAARSFTIAPIKNLFLCYDNGEVGATTQKISRALSSGEQEKDARIFSMSFDPTRDEKIDSTIITTVMNYAKRNGIADKEKAYRQVLATLDIFSCTTNGRVRFQPDTYMAQLLNKNVMGQIVGNQADLSLLTDEQLELLTAVKIKKDKVDLEIAPKGKTFSEKKEIDKSTSSKSERQKLLDLARRKLAIIFKHLPKIAFATESRKTIMESLTVINNDIHLSEWVINEYGVSPQTLLDFFDSGVLNYDLANLQMIADFSMVE